MSRTVTLAQLRTDIGTQADILVQDGGRYDPDKVNRLINQSINRFRQRISIEGVQHFLVPYLGTMTSGATSGFAFKVIDLGALNPPVSRVFGFEVTMPGSVQVSLEQVPFADRNNFGGPALKGEPLVWMQTRDTQLAVLPPPNQSYAYTVWYLPVLPDLAADSDTFDGVAGWEDFIVYDVVCRLIARDTYATAYGLAVAERDRIWQDIVRCATKVTGMGGAVLGRDSMGARANSYYGRRGILPPP